MELFVFIVGSETGLSLNTDKKKTFKFSPRDDSSYGQASQTEYRICN
jgi:hypothetical protein